MPEEQNYLKQIRAQRELWVPLPDSKIELHVRRPPLLWMSKWQEDGSDIYAMLLECLVGWKNFKESDLLGAQNGSTEVDVPFNVILACEWISDRPNYAIEVSNALKRNLADRAAQKEKQKGN